jgi:hypothetical protein
MSNPSIREQNLWTYDTIIQLTRQPLGNIHSLGADLSRMAMKFTLFKGFQVSSASTDENVIVQSEERVEYIGQIFVENEKDKNKSHIYELFSAMFNLLPEEYKGTKQFTDWKSYDEKVNLAHWNSVNQWLQEFGEEHVLVTIAKIMQQAIVTKFLLHIKDMLKSKGTLTKDVQGSWKVSAYFPSKLLNSNTLGYEDKICLCQRRREQVYRFLDVKSRRKPQNLFQFEWELVIFIDLDGSIYDIFVRVVDKCIELNESMKLDNPEIETKVNAVLDAYQVSFRKKRFSLSLSIPSFLKHLRRKL